VHGERPGRDGVDLLLSRRAKLHDRALAELLLDLQDRLIVRPALLAHCHSLTRLIAPEKERRRLASPRRHQFRWGVLGGQPPGCHQVSFSFRLGLTISKVMGWIGWTNDFLRSSFSSCSLDFFLAFLSFASPRPVGIGPSHEPPLEACRVHRA